LDRGGRGQRAVFPRCSLLPDQELNDEIFALLDWIHVV
jgi:hypothetical protein